MNDQFPLTIRAGAHALTKLSEAGWQPELFTTMVGASGGAKLLGLGHLDRFLFADYLQRTDHKLDLYGSSIGSWRHAALAAPDPLDAISTLQERYINQRWAEDDPRNPGEIVDELCQWVLDGILSDNTIDHICTNPRFTTHVITARGLGMNQSQAKLPLILGMGSAAVANAVSRNWLARGFQRTVFSSGHSKGFIFRDFNTQHIPLQSDNLRSALLASGSIPFLMSGQRDIHGAPAGHYWDGGIIDYHFDFRNFGGDGLVLYPHFSDTVIKGWFDKKLPWRKNSAELLKNVVVIAPSAAFVSSLPNGRIPDRRDFQRMSQDERLSCWNRVLEQTKLLAEAFAEVVDGNRVVAQPF